MLKYLYLILSWVFGVIILLTAVSSLVESPLAGLCLIAVAALLLPPVRIFVHSKINKSLSGKARAISILILFVVFGIFTGQAQDMKAQQLAVQKAREIAEKAAHLQQENINHFNANRDEIISLLEKALLEKQYQSVVSLSNKYLASGDKRLAQMNAQAQKKLSAIQKTEKTDKLLAELKLVSKEKYELNRKLYRQLLNLHPDNEFYKTKVAFYTKRIENEKQEQLAAEARGRKIKSQFSPWDGSHRNLVKIIKESMNDPDSYDHVKTVYWDRGDHLVVRTSFRGRNAFGGIVKNSVKAKVSLDNQVLQILDQY
jgi:hypothetical protein